MSKVFEQKLLSYEETLDRELKPYFATDQEGKTVKIQLKAPSHHQSEHQWEQHPTVFYNLGSIIQNPDRVNHSRSKNPNALKHLAEGEVLIYEKDDYMYSLGVDFVTEPIGDTTKVIVKYDRDKGKNYTLSYRIDK